MYQRIIPRDLFNEAKLLKCIGQLVLIIHDGKDEKGNRPTLLRAMHDGDPFEIHQDPSDGGLFIMNLQIIRDGNEELDLKTNYNSKKPYPLVLHADDGMCYVFNDDGTLSNDFLTYLASPIGVEQ